MFCDISEIIKMLYGIQTPVSSICFAPLEKSFVC